MYLTDYCGLQTVKLRPLCAFVDLKMAIAWKTESDVIRPDLGQRVGALFTERVGGVSSGPWGGPEGIMGLNVGVHVSDNASCVRMNRSLVAQMTSGEPRWMTQVHGTDVVDAETVERDEVKADAQTSLTPGVVCAVQVADCLPVLIAEKDGKAVAAVHAGWRSLAAGIVEKTVRRLRERLGNPDAQFKAWLGPRIGFDDFETSEETARTFKAHFGDVKGAVKAAGEPGKCFLSLAAYASEALKREGVRDVEDCGLSTVADPAHFYSYRRDGEKTGRHAALIWIEPEDKTLEEPQK